MTPRCLRPTWDRDVPGNTGAHSDPLLGPYWRHPWLRDVSVTLRLTPDRDVQVNNTASKNHACGVLQNLHPKDQIVFNHTNHTGLLWKFGTNSTPKIDISIQDTLLPLYLHCVLLRYTNLVAPPDLLSACNLCPAPATAPLQSYIVQGPLLPLSLPRVTTI